MNGIIVLRQFFTENLVQIPNNVWVGLVIVVLFLLSAFIGVSILNLKLKRNNEIITASLKDNANIIVSRVVTEMTKYQYTHQPPIVTKIKVTPDREVPLKIVIQIKKKLQKFEKKQEYLDPELKLTKLAECFETNTKYLSKVIFKEKGKPYKAYIKDLKVAFAKSRIDAEYKFRRYKMEVIANECGFKTAESFSKWFLNRYKMYPSKYIRQVEQNVKKTRLN